MKIVAKLYWYFINKILMQDVYYMPISKVFKNP